MGIYDRDYYRQGRSGFRLRAPRSAVGAIILLNVAVFVLEIVERIGRRAVGRRIALRPRRRPALDATSTSIAAGRYASAALDVVAIADLRVRARSLATCQHILFNMLVLFFLGRDVEAMVRNAGIHPPLPGDAGILLAGLGGDEPAVRSAPTEHLAWGLGGDCRRRGALRPELSQADPPVHVRASAAGLARGRDGDRLSTSVGAMGRARSAHRLYGPPGRSGLRLGLLQPALELRPALRVGRRLAERPFAAFAQGLQARG